MTLTEAIAARQRGPATVAVPIEDINETNRAYEALVLDRIRLLDQITNLEVEIIDLREDNLILTERVAMFDDLHAEMGAELFERNDALIEIRNILENQSIDF